MTTSFTRTRVPGRLAKLDFSIDVPEGFIQPELPDDQPDFDEPTQSAPLALFSSQVALALIAVAARPAYSTGSVLQWLRYLANHFDIDLQHVQIREIGDPPTHMGVTAFATQVQDGKKFHLMMVAFEDGERFVTAHGMCPKELWPSFGDALSKAVESITLDKPLGRRHDVDSTTAEGWDVGRRASSLPASVLKAQAQAKADSDRYAEERRAKREPAVAAAQKLLETDQFDEAEKLILAADSSIDGGVEISRMYERRLRLLVEKGSLKREKERVEKVFARALSWAQNCYPEPHTEMEADNYATGRAEDRSRLVAILGYDPKL